MSIGSQQQRRARLHASAITRRTSNFAPFSDVSGADCYKIEWVRLRYESDPLAGHRR